jgi:predicted GNAT family N-acyltransferase
LNNYQFLTEIDGTVSVRIWKHFCKQQKQSLPQRDDHAVFLQAEQQPIGLIRLVETSQNHYWLIGLFIAPNFRTQGLARQTLQFALKQLPRPATITLFSREYLVNFYQSEGFLPINTEKLDSDLQKQWQSAVKNGKNWVLMQRSL